MNRIAFIPSHSAFAQLSPVLVVHSRRILPLHVFVRVSVMPTIPSPPSRRSSRLCRRLVPIEEFCGYPDDIPSTPLEKCIAALDQQSFPATDFARVDDIVVNAMFASKRHAKSYRALRPARAFFELEHTLKLDEALGLCKIIETASKTTTDALVAATNSTAQIIQSYPQLFSGKQDATILKQYVSGVSHSFPNSLA